MVATQHYKDVYAPHPPSHFDDWSFFDYYKDAYTFFNDPVPASAQPQPEQLPSTHPSSQAPKV